MTLSLGTTRRGRPLTLTDEERSRHVHLVGASGTGKSKLLESLIQQDILKDRGLCLIDPHGTLSDAIVEWCAALSIEDRRRVHVLDLKDETWCAGFNPLGVAAGNDVEARVDAMVATCAEVWGGEDINQTPLLTTCLQLVFYALAASNLTLAEATELTASDDPHTLRKRLTTSLPNPEYERYWREFSTLSKRDFEERFSSTRRRLLRFLGSPVVRRLVGQRNCALDIKSIMDNGEILIINLAKQGAVSDENARLVGALILSEFRLCAVARDLKTGPVRPYNLYIDECYQYLTGDVESMLDETRKFGLHVVLAHQRLGQLRKRSDELCNAVMGGAQTKIVFGGMNDSDAEEMAKEVYRSSFNLERPKHVLDKPVVVDEVPYWLDSQSWTEGESWTESASATSNWARSSGESEGLATSLDAFGNAVTGTIETGGVFTSEVEGGGSSTAYANARSESSTRGRTQTLKPIRLTMPTAVYSLEEEQHLAIVKLRELPNQAAIVKRRGHLPVRIRPATVRSAIVCPESTARFLSRTRAASPYMINVADAEAHIAARSEALRLAEKPEVETEPFWQ